MWKLKEIVPSEKPKKKWDAIFQDGKEKKIVSFGASGYRDFTLIYPIDQEEAYKARSRYWKRHKKDLEADPMSPAYLSLFVLWGKFPSVEKNMRWYKKLFGF
jgi:hypothetical protein